MRLRRSENGFALITALGVLAILGILVIAGSNAVQFSYSLSHLRSNEDAVSVAVSQAPLILAARPELLKELKPDAPSVVIPGRATSPKDVEVSATLVTEAEMASVRPNLPAREGDVFVRLVSESAARHGRVRESVYLVNNAGHRPSPILISEVRK